VTEEFEKAVSKLVRDAKLDQGAGADLVAVGVQRSDCLEMLETLLEDEPEVTDVLLAVIVQFAVVVGVWLERARWQEVIQDA
jgi:hypothetical protein